MTKDQIIITLLIIGLLGLVFGIVYFLPTLITVLKSRYYGLKISFRQGRTLVKNHCVSKDFLISISEIWEVYPVPLIILINHFHAGGNLDNLKNGISEMITRNKEPNINTLSALELSKHDLRESVRKAASNNWRFEF